MEASTPPIRVAVIDLYNNIPNEGMRAIRELLTAADERFPHMRLTFDVFETRYKNEVPDLGYDIYLSSGGPGSPFDGEGKPWEASYFRWLESVWNHNQAATGSRKHVLFICHSFQMMCRFFEVADVVKRRSESFGIFPVHKTSAGNHDVLFEGLAEPFYAADFRKWQVIRADRQRVRALGAQILAREKIRPYVDLERAIMALRISPELVGTQFHPEADPPGMSRHFRKPARKKSVVEAHGEEKYARILHRLEDPNFLTRTHDAVIPNFLRRAISALRPEYATTEV